MMNIQGLQFGYRPKQPLFSGLDLELAPGNLYGLLGRNGAGKSSLLRLMAGLLHPWAGQCRLLGQPTHLRRADLLANLYLLPEEMALPRLRVDEYAHLYGPFYPRFSYAEFAGHLRQFEIDGHQPLAALSFGQRKKALIAFALATNTALLLMDEPTNGLDIPSKAQFRRLLASAVQPERTIVISTHQVRDLENLIDPIVILENNQVLLHASLAQITERLHFGFYPQVPAHQPVLYQESSLRGHAVVAENTGLLPGHGLDLELLFHAVLAQPQKIRELFAAVRA
jgi:ABC-2 type transport system ATP-binding protein